MYCQCLTAKGVQCTNVANDPHQFCKQHQKCDKILVLAITDTGKTRMMPMTVPKVSQQYQLSPELKLRKNQFGGGDSDDEDDDWEAAFDREEAEEAQKEVEREQEEKPAQSTTLKPSDDYSHDPLQLPNTKHLTEPQRISLMQRNNIDRENVKRAYLRKTKPTTIENNSAALNKILGDLAGNTRAWQRCRSLHSIMEGTSVYEVKQSMSTKAQKEVLDSFKTCTTEQEHLITAFNRAIKNIRELYEANYHSLSKLAREEAHSLAESLSELWETFDGKANYLDVARKLRKIWDNFLNVDPIANAIGTT